MSILTNTLKATQSPARLQCLLNDNALIFCCVKPQDEENSKQLQETKETTEIKENEESRATETKGEEFPPSLTDETIMSNNEEPTDEEKDEEIATQISIQQIEENEENDLYIEDLDNLSDCEVNVINDLVSEIPNRTKTAELQVKIGMYSEKPCLTLTIVDAYDLVNPFSEGTPISEIKPVLTYSVHILVLPSKRHRFKSKIRKGPNPYFDEVIKIPKINPETLKTWILRFRLYVNMKGSAKIILGEGYLFLDLLQLEMKSQCKISLLNYDPSVPENVVDTMISASICNYESMMSLDSLDGLDNLPEGEGCPELLIGLSYNPNIGRLTLEIIKGNYFPKSKKNKYPDAFITILLLSTIDPVKISAKTNVRKGTSEPIFEETFFFQIKNNQIEETYLTISGCFKRRIGKNPTFGAFVIGNQSSTEEETIHWNDLKCSTSGDQVLRWHKLLSSDKV